MSIAFGSRGSGNAMAHYEPLREVINLTKMKGAGSLAHEWGHALDDILRKKEGHKGFMTENSSIKESKSIIKILFDARFEELTYLMEKDEKNLANHTEGEIDKNNT